MLSADILEIAGKKFTSRLIAGTGKYQNMSIMVEAIKASGAEIVTVAIRRLDLENPKQEVHPKSVPRPNKNEGFCVDVEKYFKDSQHTFDDRQPWSPKFSPWQ